MALHAARRRLAPTIVLALAATATLLIGPGSSADAAGDTPRSWASVQDPVGDARPHRGFETQKDPSREEVRRQDLTGMRASVGADVVRLSAWFVGPLGPGSELDWTLQFRDAAGRRTSFLAFWVKGSRGVSVVDGEDALHYEKACAGATDTRTRHRVTLIVPKRCLGLPDGRWVAAALRLSDPSADEGGIDFVTDATRSTGWVR